MVSRLLVALQFIAFVVLACPPTLLGVSAAAGNLEGAARVCLWSGALWLAWALRANPPGNFNVRPVPRPGARLAVTGPYRWVRHPMYAGALLSFLSAVLWWPLWWKALAWAALAAVLTAKARLEEAGLLAQFPAYAAYRRSRRMLVPFLF